MASPTVDPAAEAPLQLDSVASVDLRLLSQSELYALSLCSDASFDPRRCDDVVIPKIDKSVFNESAGSRKQTYYRLRLAPAASTSGDAGISATVRRRGPHLRSPKPRPSVAVETDPERAENIRIITLLMQLFPKDTRGNDLIPVRVHYSDSLPQLSNVSNNVGKRKRGRPRKHENMMVPLAVEVAAVAGDGAIKDIVVYGNVDDKDREIVNRHGVVVDLAVLATLEDPYEAELRRRTEGLRSEEELLGFLCGLSGQWESWRRKKKIVDANEFGDVLPKGWKLSLSLKKKAGRVWLFCRRYISPNGRQFMSCKEVSAYLYSILGLQDSNHSNFAHSSENMQFAYGIISGHEDKENGGFLCHSSSPIEFMSNDPEWQGSPKIENPVELQSGEILRSQESNLTSDVKENSLQHHLQSQWRKRSKVGAFITDGVIVEDDKYECQFCRMTFNEWNCYNDHIEARVKDHLKSAETSNNAFVQSSVDTVLRDQVPLNESLQSSICDKLNTDSPESLSKECSNMETCSGRLDLAFLVNKNEKALAEESGHKPDTNCISYNDKSGSVQKHMEVIITKSDSCLGSVSALSNNENNSKNETSGDANVIEPITENAKTNEGFVEKERCPENDVLISTLNDCTSVVENNATMMCPTVEKPNQIAGLQGTLVSRNDEQNTSGTDNELESPLECHSAVPCRDSVTGMYGSNWRQEGFESDLLTHSRSSVTESSHVYNTNNEPRREEVQDSGNQEPTLPFFHSHVQQDNAETPFVAQYRHPADCSTGFSGIQQAFDTLNDSRKSDNMTVEDLKQGSSSSCGLDSSFCNGKTYYVENKFDKFCAGKVWEQPEVVEVGNSAKNNYMISFTNSQTQPNEEAVAGGTWRSCEENVQQSGLADISAPLQQPPSYLHTFDILSDKCEESIFRVDEKLDSQPDSEQLRSCRAQPIEFTFLTTESSHSLPGGESKVFTYDAGREQGFDSTIWIGKDALMPNVAGGGQVTAVCVWCRNNFHQDSVHPGAQTGAIGSLCPTCNSRMSETLNVL